MPVGATANARIALYVEINAISQFRRAIGDDRPYKIVLFLSKPYIQYNNKPQFTAVKFKINVYRKPTTSSTQRKLNRSALTPFQLENTLLLP